jgi:hypothetical protein
MRSWTDEKHSLSKYNPLRRRLREIPQPGLHLYQTSVLHACCYFPVQPTQSDPKWSFWLFTDSNTALCEWTCGLATVDRHGTKLIQRGLRMRIELFQKSFHSERVNPAESAVVGHHLHHHVSLIGHSTRHHPLYRITHNKGFHDSLSQHRQKIISQRAAATKGCGSIHICCFTISTSEASYFALTLLLHVR